MAKFSDILKKIAAPLGGLLGGVLAIPTGGLSVPAGALLGGLGGGAVSAAIPGGGGNVLGPTGTTPSIGAGSNIEDILRQGTLQNIEFAKETLQPFAKQLLGATGPRIGMRDVEEFLPDIIRTARGQVRERLDRPLTTTEPFRALKENLLGEFDVGFERFTRGPLEQQLIKQGLFTSGPGIELLREAGTKGARERALLGSGIDVQALQMGEQARTGELERALGIGRTELNLANLLGFQQPTAALAAAQGVQAPQLTSLPQAIPEPVQPDVGGNILGQVLGAAVPSIIDLLGGIFKPTPTPQPTPQPADTGGIASLINRFIKFA